MNMWAAIGKMIHFSDGLYFVRLSVRLTFKYVAGGNLRIINMVKHGICESIDIIKSYYLFIVVLLALVIEQFIRSRISLLLS